MMEDAVDILTDEERVNNAFKATVSGSNLALLVLYGINACLQWFNFFSFFNSHIFSKSSLYSLLVWNSLFIVLLGKYIFVFFKKMNLLNCVKRNEEVYLGTKHVFPISGNAIMITLLVMLLLYDFSSIGGANSVIIVFVILVSSFIVSWLIGKFRPDSDTNGIIQILYGVFITLF